MVQLFSLAITAILAAVSVASPIEITPRGWPLGSVNCGGAVHSLSAVMSATSSGFAHVGRPIGSSKFVAFMIQRLMSDISQIAILMHSTTLKV